MNQLIKLIIFDLDNTLFDTYGQLGVNVLDKMIKKMKKAGLTKEQEVVIREKYSVTGFRVLARQMGLSEKVMQIGMSTYKNMDLSHIKPFDDIKLIKDFKQKKVLVTTGTEEVQLKKVNVLGIKALFEKIFVDKLSSAENKQKIFLEIIKTYGIKPGQVMVVGDNSESEITAGNRLGMVTVQILRRPFLKGKADYYVKDLYGVREILQK